MSEDVIQETESVTQEEEREAKSTAESSGNIDNKSLEGILASINADFDSTIGFLTKELETTYSSIGDSYEGYVVNKQSLSDWYALVQSESEKLFERTKENSIKYFKLIVSSITHSDLDAELKYYMEVTGRITQKLADMAM